MKKIATLVAGAALLWSSAVLADKTTGQVIDDSIVQSEAKAKLMADDFLGGMGINLETRKGVVQLGGFVDDMDKAKAAAARVAEVDGVVKVDNQLHLKPGEATAGQTVDDTVITTRTKTAIGDADLGTGFKVNVDTYNGVVLLTGFVDTKEQKKTCGELAAGVANVKDVINGIYVFD